MKYLENRIIMSIFAEQWAKFNLKTIRMMPCS